MSENSSSTAPAEIHQALDHVYSVLNRLLAPDGCPWDREQTPESLTEYLIEEVHELVDAIRSGNGAEIGKEMGDVAFLLLFVSHLTANQKGASMADALESSAAKMIRRHPHVFGTTEYSSREEQLKDWERIKRAEKAAEGSSKPSGLFDSLPAGLPPLTKAYRIHSKAAQVGFTWDEDKEVEQQVEAEWLELLDAMEQGKAEAIAHEFGDCLFSLVELGRRKGLKAAPVLDAANRRFLARFAKMEELARQKGQVFADLSLDEKDDLWNQAKADNSGTGKTENTDQKES